VPEIGGLTAALALRARGIEVLVFDSVREIGPVGVGISLLPHGARELIEFGLGQPLAETGIEMRAFKYLSRYAVRRLWKTRAGSGPAFAGRSIPSTAARCR
jgi:2-polyprenyl-6-methoxyphenol hydroxylase-like FAD-dependent oxidoreductase